MNLEFHEAKNRLLDIVKIKKISSTVPLENALGGVCAKSIFCVKNLPSYNNAALDGFAFSHKDDLDKLNIVATIYAGDVQNPILKDNECYKIMTGAKVPKDADTILAFEDAISYTDETVTLPKQVKKGNAFRFKGEEQKKGSILIEKGTRLNPSHIAMLAAQGITHVPIVSLPTIAVVSTGDELKEPWETSNEDEIYNCNSYAIKALLNKYGFKADYTGVIPDNLEDSKSFIKNLCNYDLLITSGGISMGEADFVKAGLDANGFKMLFHGINIKPGRPTMVGNMGETLVISLPGNPMAAYLNAFLLVIPALFKGLGSSLDCVSTIKASNKDLFKCKGNRNEFVLGFYENGEFQVTRGNKYGSGMLTPLLESNALFISGTKTTTVGVGESLEIMLLP